jgi:hypothetical protein
MRELTASRRWLAGGQHEPDPKAWRARGQMMGRQAGKRPMDDAAQRRTVDLEFELAAEQRRAHYETCRPVLVERIGEDVDCVGSCSGAHRNIF